MARSSEAWPRLAASTAWLRQTVPPKDQTQTATGAGFNGLSGNGVDTAWTEGMAATDTPHGQGEPFPAAVPLQGLERVLAAGGAELAGTDQEWPQEDLVSAKQQHQPPDEESSHQAPNSSAPR